MYAWRGERACHSPSRSLSLSHARRGRRHASLERVGQRGKEKKRGVSELRRLDLEHQFFFFRRRQRTLVSLADASSPARAFFLAPPGAAMGPTSRLAAAVSAAGATAWTAAVSRCLNAFFLDALMIEHFFSQPRPPPPSSSLLLSPFTTPPHHTQKNFSLKSTATTGPAPPSSPAPPRRPPPRPPGGPRRWTLRPRQRSPPSPPLVGRRRRPRLLFPPRRPRRRRRGGPSQGPRLGGERQRGSFGRPWRKKRQRRRGRERWRGTRNRRGLSPRPRRGARALRQRPRGGQGRGRRPLGGGGRGAAGENKEKVV